MTYLLHDPVANAEAIILPSTPRDKIEKALEDGKTLIKEDEGKREIITIDDLPEPEEPKNYTLVGTDYVDKRMTLLLTFCQLMINSLAGVLQPATLQTLKLQLEKMTNAIKSGDLQNMDQTASDMGQEGPSIE